MDDKKPFGRSYGSIPHLPGSRTGPGDYTTHEGQAAICTTKARDRHDLVVLLEKLDGSNTAVGRKGDEILAITRAGYLASTSPYEQHHSFHEWVAARKDVFLSFLKDGERVCGEWLAMAHGTRYHIKDQDDAFVAFDIMRGKTRLPYRDLVFRLDGMIKTAHILHIGAPITIEQGIRLLGDHGHHGAVDLAEGLVWRVERRKRLDNNSSEREHIVDFLAKYVRSGKEDGKYFSKLTGEPDVWNI